jgi:ABC-2 type transport system permease protein/Cu-processing system permease protein
VSAEATGFARTLGATFARELLSYRINRFLHAHVLLMLGIGVLALIAPPEAGATGTAWWTLNGVIYVASLSALLLGLSSAQAEQEEFPLLFTQPVRLGAWVAGKCLGAAAVMLPSAVCLFLPSVWSNGVQSLAFGAALAAAAVSLLWAWLGLALGLWIEDGVRGLIAALVLWCVLLFGVDLALVLAGGTEWARAHPAIWVAVMMASPLDAYRVTLLFVFEGAAFSGAKLNALTAWWLAHPALWLGICLGLWLAVAFGGAWIASCRRRR